MKKWGREIILIGVIVTIAVIGRSVSPNFLSFRNIVSLLNNTAAIVLVVIGESLVIINGFGNTDLSVSSIYTVSAVTSAQLASIGTPMVLVILWSVFIGAALGALNGIITVKFNIPSLVVTIGTMMVWEGFILWWTHGEWIANLPNTWQISNFTVIGLPLIIWIGFLGAVFMIFVTKKIPLFRQFYACGTNISATTFVGINAKQAIFYALTFSGIFSGFSGFLSASRFFMVSSSIGSNITLPAVAAAVIGGTSVFGGKGKMEGNILGAFLLTEITSITVFLNIKATWSNAIEGLIILIAVVIDSLKESKKRGAIEL